MLKRWPSSAFSEKRVTPGQPLTYSEASKSFPDIRHDAKRTGVAIRTFAMRDPDVCHALSGGLFGLFSTMTPTLVMQMARQS